MVAEDDEAATGGAEPADEPFPLLIAVTPSPTERIRLAERLDGGGRAAHVQLHVSLQHAPVG